jgi:hypothetical protein
MLQDNCIWLAGYGYLACGHLRKIKYVGVGLLIGWRRDEGGVHAAITRNQWLSLSRWTLQYTGGMQKDSEEGQQTCSRWYRTLVDGKQHRHL